MKRLMGWLCLAAMLVVAVPGSALAQEEEDTEPRKGGNKAFHQPGGLFDTSEQERSQMLSVFGILPWYYGFGFGAGVRYGIPVVPNGFVPTLNDSFSLEFGGDFWFSSHSVLGFSSNYIGLAIPVEGMWTFHLTSKLGVYGKLGLGWEFYFWDTDFSNNDGFNSGGLYFNGASGVMYKLSDKMWLRGELGYAGLRGGLGFVF